MAELIVRESSRSPREVIDSLRAHAESFGFVIRNVYDMKETFALMTPLPLLPGGKCHAANTDSYPLRNRRPGRPGPAGPEEGHELHPLTLHLCPAGGWIDHYLPLEQARAAEALHPIQ